MAAEKRGSEGRRTHLELITGSRNTRGGGGRKRGERGWMWQGRLSGMPPSSPILLGSSPLEQQFNARGKEGTDEEGTKEGASPFLGSFSLIPTSLSNPSPGAIFHHSLPCVYYPLQNTSH